jgi:serine protease Do
MSIRSFANTAVVGALLAGTAAAQRPAPPAPPAAPVLAAAAPEPPEPPEPPMPPEVQLFTGGSFLGVNVSEIDAERAKELKLREERGVEVTGVEESSPAEKAGLKKGDVVLEYNGQSVEGTQQFIRLVRETPSGRTVKLSVVRGGAPVTVSATVAARKGRSLVSRGGSIYVDVPMPKIVIPDIPRPKMSWGNSTIGVEAEGVEGPFAEFFGVKEGALIRSVTKGSPAEKAGLKVGDVVTKVDGTRIATARDLSNEVRSNRSKKSLAMTVVREKRETTLTVTVDEDPRSMPSPARAVRQRL